MGLDEYLKRFNKESELMQSPATPEDETTYRDNLRNTVVGKLNLPDSFKSSLADEKKYDQNAPAMIAGGTMGSVAPVARFGKTLNTMGAPIERASADAVKAAAAPELEVLRAQKMSLAPSAYDSQKQAIFNKIRKTLGGE